MKTFLVANPGFESGGSWSEVRNSAFPGTSFYKATTGAHGGSASYIISNQAYGYAQTGQMAAEAGAEYDLYAKVRGELDPEDSLGSWRLWLTFYDSTGTLISNQDTGGGSPETLTSTWTLVGGRVTAPANAATLRVRLLNYQTSGWVAFDAISLTRVAGSQVSYLAYDAENRLKSVSGEVNASYAYDGDGRRVKMVVGGVTTVFAGETFEWTGSTLYYLLAEALGSTTGTAAAAASRHSRRCTVPGEKTPPPSSSSDWIARIGQDPLE